MKKVLSVVALAALLLAVLSGCSMLGLGGESGKDLGVTETREVYIETEAGEDGETWETTIYPLGNTAKFRNWDITFKSAKVQDEVKATGNQVYTSEDGYSFLVCTFEIKNNGDEDSQLLSLINVLSENHCIFYALEWDFIYEFDDDMGYDASDLYNKTVAAGATLEGTITFFCEDVDLAGVDQWYIQFYTEGSTVPGNEVDEDFVVFTVFAA